MPWVVFPDEATFTAWHDAACAEHGIPHPGQTVERYAFSAAWTTQLVMPYLVDGQIAALIDDAAVAADPVLSGLATLERTQDDVVEPVPFTVAQPIPDVWTDPEGTPHDTKGHP